jgi:hypothetical protein
MKSEFLKLAKCKTVKQFYDKFPDEAAFFEAYPQAKKMIKKAQVGTVMSGMSNYLQGMQNLPNMQNVIQGQTQSSGVNANMYNNSVSNNTVSLSPEQLANDQSGWSDPNTVQPNFNQNNNIAEQVSKFAPTLVEGFNVYKNLRAERRAKKEAQMWANVTDVQARASETQDIDDYRQYADSASRKRNALMPVTTGEQFFPTQGVGTNVLSAKYGANLRGGGEIQNTYAPGTLYDNLEYEPLTNPNQVKAYKKGGYIKKANPGIAIPLLSGALSMTGNFLGGQNQAKQPAGGQSTASQIGAAAAPIGSAIGGNNATSSIGSIVSGPINMIPGLQGVGDIVAAPLNIAGGLLNTNPRDTRKAQARTKNNMNRMMTSQYRNNIQGQFGGSMEYGGEISNMEEGGELNTHWGGYAEPMSYNPYLPDGGETVMFRGNSHEEYDGQGNTGIGVSYGGGDEANVEVERGEPATKLKDGGTGEDNLVVYGNLKIPKYGVELLEDPKARNKKFKNYVADLSKEETKQNKLIDKSSTSLDELEPNTAFDKLELASYEANIKGGNMKLKEIADKKIKAAGLQSAINDTAEEYGLVADDLAKGKTTIDKKAMKLREAMFGTSIRKFEEGGELPKLKEEDYAYITNLYETAEKTKNSADILKFQKEFHRLAPEYAKKVIGKSPLTNYAKKKGYAIDDLRGNEDAIFEKRTKDYMSALREGMAKNTRSEDLVAPAVTKTEAETDSEEDAVFDVQAQKRNPWLDIAGQALNYLRPTNQEGLSANQLMGETFALSSNQLEPVQAQFYRPELDVPYDISFQDQLNEITASERGAQRMSGYNPAAQSMIAGQAYGAKSSVLADQFRANQAMKDQVYSRNRQTLNDAQLKNLAIADTQYTRQEQAKSNTKATAQEALNSISSKYAQNALENRTLGTYENLYNYRYDKSGRAINMNAPYQANIPTVYSPMGDVTYEAVLDANGKTVGFKPIKTNKPTSTSSTEKPSLTTNTYVNPKEQDYISIEEEENNNEKYLYETSPKNKVAPKNKYGGKTKKNYSQSSIVKMFK